LADEPTGNLDIQTGRQIVKLLKKINETGKTILMATHNFEIVNEMNQRVIELKKGKLATDQKRGKYPLT
jgi:cell division transport system ATP-binding protein